MSQAPIETTDDKLLGGSVYLRQPASGYRVAIDPVLLAASVPKTVTGRVLDLGCGVGAVMLCLARRREDLTVVGLERDPAIAEIAAHNIEANEFKERVSVVTGDLLKPPRDIEPGFDAVVANPPFLEADAADPSPNPKKAAANVESEADLLAWTKAAAEFVKPGGMVLFIHRADRLADLRAALDKAGCGDHVIAPIWPRISVPPKRVIVKATRGAKPAAQSGTGLILHETSGAFTAHAEEILRNGSPLTV